MMPSRLYNAIPLSKKLMKIKTKLAQFFGMSFNILAF